MHIVFNNMGAAHAEIGQNKQAIGYWKKALKVHPFMTEVHINMGVIYERMGKKKKAMAVYLKALEQDDYNANIQTRQIHLAFFIGKNSKIKRFLGKKLNLVIIIIFFSTKENEKSFRDGSNDFILNRHRCPRDTLCKTILIDLFWLGKFWFVKTAPQSDQQARKTLLLEPPRPIQTFTTAKHLRHRPS